MAIQFFSFFTWLMYLLLFRFKYFLYILGINNPSSDIYFANTYQSLIWLFILLTMSFTEWKFLIITKSNLSYFSFMDYAAGNMFKNLITKLKVVEIFPILHLGLWNILVNFFVRLRTVSRFCLLLHIYYFSVICLKDYLFSIE